MKSLIRLVSQFPNINISCKWKYQRKRDYMREHGNYRLTTDDIKEITETKMYNYQEEAYEK